MTPGDRFPSSRRDWLRTFIAFTAWPWVLRALGRGAPRDLQTWTGPGTDPRVWTTDELRRWAWARIHNFCPTAALLFRRSAELRVVEAIPKAVIAIVRDPESGPNHALAAASAFLATWPGRTIARQVALDRLQSRRVEPLRQDELEEALRVLAESR